MFRLFALVFSFSLFGCASPDSEMLSLARQRLDLAPDVAWTKFSQNIPVYDAARESSILKSAMSTGRQFGISEDVTRKHFAVQMEASRRLQWHLIHAWRKGFHRPESPPRSLSNDLRPLLDKNQLAQIHALARGAQPLSLSQLTEESERLLPKN